MLPAGPGPGRCALGRHDEALAELRQLAATPEGAEDHYVAEEIQANERRRQTTDA
jgi:hypothetical protein